MKELDLIQGTAEWLAVRAKSRTASEAPAMMGASKHMTRTELLRLKKTGIAPEVDAATQRRFDDGHATEALARTIIEKRIGEDLYPITATTDDGYLLASLDGLDMLGTIVFEHKLWSEALAEQVRAGDLDPHYYWQLEQELLVTGAEKVIFVSSDGTEERMVSMDYHPVEGRAQALIAGWKQFDADLESFDATAPIPEKVVAAPVESLPAVSVRIAGSMTVASNLPVFGDALKAYIARVVVKPTTDQEFADTEAACKALKKAEEAIDAAEDQLTNGITDVAEAKRIMGDLRALARSTRLACEKSVAAQKDQIRLDIVTRGRTELAEHVVALNKRLGSRVRLTEVPADFAGAIKGKRTIESLTDAVNTTLAKAKIEANAIADRAQINLQKLDEIGGEFPTLFPDLQALVFKASEDFEAVVLNRVSAHRTKLEEAAAELQRRREADEDARKEREELAALAAREREENEVRMAREREENAAQAIAQTAKVVEALPANDPAPTPVAAPAVHQIHPQREAATEPATLNVGAICTRIGFTVSSAFLSEKLGVNPATTDKRASLYTESQFQLICMRLIAHISNVSRQPLAA